MNLKNNVFGDIGLGVTHKKSMKTLFCYAVVTTYNLQCYSVCMEALAGDMQWLTKFGFG